MGTSPITAAAQTTNAANQSELREQLLKLVAQLQEKLLVLQRKQYEKAYQKNTNIIHGNSYVEAQQKVHLYKQPNDGRSIAIEKKGARGEVSGGPRLIEGQVWWQVAFEKGGEGWLQEKYLERIPSIIISQDTNGDGVDDVKMRVIGNYDASRIFLFPSSEGVTILNIPEHLQIVEKYDRAYRTAQLDDKIDGPVRIIQSNPYSASGPFSKGKNESVPIAWTAQNVPMNSKIEIEIEAVRLIGGNVSGGTWSSDALFGDVVGVYYEDIGKAGTLGTGDYKSQVRLKECRDGVCSIIAESPYRYFSIRK